MNGWKFASFTEVVSARGSGNKGLRQSEWQDNGRHPVIGQGAEQIEGHSDRDDLLLHPNRGLVLYGGHTRRSKHVDYPFIPGPNVRILTPDKNLDPKFLHRFLQQLHIENKGYADHFSEVKRCKIPLPPIAEQIRIAGILDAADALRAKRRESLARLDTLLQSAFLHMFGDPVTNPMGWEVQALGAISDVRDGTHESPKYVEAGHPLLTSKNFKDGAIDYTGANLISDEDFRQINKRSKVDAGDLVMPMIGTIGNPVLVERDPDFAIKNVALIKFVNDSPDNRFIRALLCSHYFDHITSKSNRGGTQKFVALKDIRGLPIPLPPLPLQHRFAQFVESVERQRAQQCTHLAELDTLFASLQHRAFQGQL